MQTVTPGASHLEVTPIAYGTWQFGGDWESVDEQASVAGLVREGLTRHVGISNYTTDQITEFAAVLPAATVQPPYHLFRRDIEAGLLPYAQARHIGVLAYGPLAHGLLGGTITEATTFGGDDWRSHSPAFTGPGFRRNLKVVTALGRFAADRGATIAQLAVAWVLAHPAVQVAIVGSRTPAHLQESVGALDLHPEPGRPGRNRQHHDRRGAARRPISGRHDMTTIQTLRAARRPGDQHCPHRPPCPAALAHDRNGARIRASHPEQGWSLLCNGVVIFDDGGALLPGGRAVLPPSARARMVAPAA